MKGRDDVADAAGKDPRASRAGSAAAPTFALPSSAPTVVYERDIGASVERIWENVLDWEHLPFLHRQAFTSVRRISGDSDGWRGEVGVPGGIAEIDVRLDRPNLRYVTSTVAGVGVGTDIVTTLFPREEHRTSIRVDFHLPWAPEESRETVGEIYRSLYVELWDQDEAMMQERQRLLDAARTQQAAGEGGAQGVLLGRVRELSSRLPLTVELAGRRFRVVSVDGQLVAHDARCPHLGGPLDGEPLDGCEAVCPWHGYRFDVRTGASSDGRGLRLRPGAVVEVRACDGEVWLRLP